jgi:molybdopterin synthase sulfur carrier subunit
MSDQVRVLFFASLREEVGYGEVQVNACNTNDLLEVLALQLSPQAMLALSQDNVRIAVNQQLIEGNVALADGDEVAFLPPVTGG